MLEFKLSPLMLFVLLLLILIVASYFSSWAKSSEGFGTETSNPFSKLANYKKYYSNLVNVSGNFWYDPINGNVYRASLTTDGKIIGANIIDRYRQIATVEFSETAEESDNPEKIIKKNTIDKIIKNWIEIDTANKIQINYMAVGEKTYIIVLDTNNTQACKIKRLLYYDNAVKKQDISPTSNNEFALISKESYSTTNVGDDGNNNTYVKEPLYDNDSRTIYQIKQSIKYDTENGNLILNFVDYDSTSPDPAPDSTSTSTSPAAPDRRRRSSYKDKINKLIKKVKEGFSAETDDTIAIKVYSRMMPNTQFITTPTNIYTTPTEKTLSTTLDKTATIPYFVSDTYRNHTIIYWPNGDTTLFVIIANCSVNELVPFEFAYFSPEEVYQEPEQEKQDTDTEKEDKDNIFDDYTKWSQYMLKTEVVPPVCPACPSCNTGGGGLCMDCGGKGGCGTKSSDGKSLATKETNEASTTEAPLEKNTNKTNEPASKSTDSASASLASSDIRRVGYNQSYQGPGAGTAPAGTNGFNRNNTGIGMVDSVPVDVYSYNGALQSKGSDFRPLTANFSSFSK